MTVPLISLFGASNEVPNDDNLAAMFDRFLLRVRVRQPRQLPLPRADEEGPRQRGGAARPARPTVSGRSFSARDLHALHQRLRHAHGVPRGLPDQVQGAHLPDPHRGHLGLRSPRGQAAQAVRRLAPCSTAATAANDGDFFILRTSGTTSIRSSSSRRSSSPVVDRYYREHPERAPLHRPARSASTICSPSSASSASCSPRASELSDIQLFSQLKNLNEIKVALRRSTRTTRARA